ncbi:MAG: T9SS type A sorting domain-containing protein [Bacteroidetes bacterium]|nr:T9SS type A sorting domain-containing protein [Bacteroidota bacterium]
MKRSIIILALLANSLLIYSQKWAPTGAKWYYSFTPGMQYELAVIESIGDVTINDVLCQKLNSYVIYAEMEPNGTYHWDTLNCPYQYTFFNSNKVFIYNSTSNGFDVLYDFSATPGDIVTVKDTPFPGYCPEGCYPDCQLFQYVIDSINYNLFINGINLKRFYTSPTENSDYVFTDPDSMVGYAPIIERLGSLKYLFGVTRMQVMEGAINCLRCYEDSTIFYRIPGWPTTLPCDYLPPLYTQLPEDSGMLKKQIKVYPNPSATNLYIQYPDGFEILGYELINLSGLICQREDFLVPQNPVSIISLRQGYYFLKLKTSRGVFYFHFIKI